MSNKFSLAPMWSAVTDVTDPDLNTLLHPASAFDHPRDVVNDPDLPTEEKRAILSPKGSLAAITGWVMDAARSWRF